MMAFVCVLIDVLNRQLRIHDRAVIPRPQNYVRYAQMPEMHQDEDKVCFIHIHIIIIIIIVLCVSICVII